MVRFDPEMTEMIFLDIEFYVPEEDRERPGASLLSNPFREGHSLLGGVFCRHFPARKGSQWEEYRPYWVWREGDEETVLRRIYEMFMESWERMRDKDPMQADLILCGIGISRFDIPVIFFRSMQYDFASHEDLFECYFKTKHVDLSDVGIPLFNHVGPVFYPKTANLLMKRLGIRKEKESGMRVWEMYDAGKHEEIERRTSDEINDCREIYEKMRHQVFKRGH